MSSEGSSLTTSFLGALQASLAVLLTVLWGVIATQFGLLSESSAKDISRTCVRMFLPALLITNVGSQLHLDTATRYVPLLLWAIMYNVLSIAFGVIFTKVFKMPKWVTPAIAFNNTTSLPLLLVQALSATGILGQLLMSDTDSPSDAVDRAKSYFLVNAMVSNSLTFALGPRLLNGQEEDAPDELDRKNEDEDEEEGSDPDGEGQGDGTDEQTSLLPDRLHNRARSPLKKTYNKGVDVYNRLPSWAQNTAHYSFQFLNAPLIGAVIGAIIGLTPPLHRLFFNDFNEGGYFNAWLTNSIKNLGDLFAALQVIVVGVKLSRAMRALKRGDESGSVSWKPVVFITLVRYLLWPLVSIPIIWALVTKTTVLGDDPVLWFAMMLMPTGPPAMKLTALADVNGSDEEEKMSIAKFLTLSYTISPLICLSVVGSLKAAVAAGSK
ncbi:hypothetical protein M501DRAFT_411682 [Patellaria atrata CBS 101060]|uniref:Membrane transporter n=1 Tax=Patellaria atrata CBS 101060 TaxID=1346257 RepID=A0A9P4VUC7_9PEZI|nr:hypothetical protein M501DRAFT_411682 [Patellaria atrata CBS 101060]